MAAITWENCVEIVKTNTGNDQKVASLSCAIPLFINILDALLAFSGVVALVMIIISGIKMVNSGGDPKQVAGARTTLTFAIVGLLVVFLALFIINFISFTTGAKCIKSFGFTNCGTPTN